MRRNRSSTRVDRRTWRGPTAALIVASVLVACSSATDDTAPVESITTGPSGAATTSAASASRESATPTESPTLDEVIADVLGDAPGGVEVLRRFDDQVEDIAVGVADADGTKLVGGRPFRVGSITKTFVATMVMQLVDEGQVELDESLGTYLPDTTIGGTITIRQLLGHRSGLPNYTDQISFMTTVLADLDRWFTPDDVVAAVADAPAGEPGEFEYSNTNYVLLGQLIEALDRRPLAESLRARVTEPLDLASTVLPTEAAPNAVVPVGAWAPGLLDGQPDAPYNSIVSTAWAAGGLVSSADDLLAFLEALFAGDLTTSGSLAEMIDVQPAEPASDGDEYGLGIMTVELDGINGYGHNGSIPGYGSLMLFDPDTGDALIALANNASIDAGPILERAGRP